jgi:hypothetical protein
VLRRSSGAASAQFFELHRENDLRHKLGVSLARVEARRVDSARAPRSGKATESVHGSSGIANLVPAPAATLKASP